MAHQSGARVRLPTLVGKSVVVHTVTYFVAGLLALTLGGYGETFAEPPLSHYMRPTSDRWVMAGPLLQPVRGLIFGLAFYPLRDVLFAPGRGWLTLWWLLVALGVLSTFGAAPGSVEGLIYTVIPPVDQFLGLWEVLLQSLLADQIETLGPGWRLVRREYPTAIGPVDILARDGSGATVAVEIKRRGELDGVEQLTRYLELLNRDPKLRPVRGIFAAQEIKPQARVLATDRGITCAVVDYDALRGMDDPTARLF